MDQHKVNMRLSVDRVLLTVRSPNNLKCECRSDPRVNGGPRVNVMEEPGGPHKLNVNDDPHVKIKMMV
ncbi:hypothetical protein M8J77_018079 [Diaphorina citri]|nr:hypothetical protein M8J77_018079 [Diaphorina citri]